MTMGTSTESVEEDKKQMYLPSPSDPLRRSLSLCVGCGGVITDPYILRVHPDLEWHARCLKCVECCMELDELSTCYVKDGKTYCKSDYLRLFCNRCSKCGGSFTKTEFVMRARSKVFHIDCFRCSICSEKLNTGEEFGIRDDALFCRADFDLQDGKPSIQTRDSFSPMDPENNNSVKMLNHNIVEDSESRDVHDEDSRSPSADSETPSFGDRCSTNGASSTGKRKGSGNSKDSKTTRVRTVLNEKQLHTLRTCYNANPRPDALMKEQLVEMTGLSPRVIRVWFQNKRCKDKKKQILFKQMEHQQQKRPLNGVQMVASSPVRHDAPTPLGSQVDVQQYTSPWATGLHPPPELTAGHLEPPPFQQLVSAYHSLYPSDDEEDDSCVSLPEGTDVGCLYPR